MTTARTPTTRELMLLTGGGVWTTRADPERGLRPIVFSDGPAGVRGQTRMEMEHTVALPSPITQGASWDVDLVERLAGVLATQAQAKGVDAVLAPVLNLQRTPRSGRHFESFSEDPLLVSTLGRAVIRGLQSRGVAACAKHYVGNDSETERMTVSMVFDERTLREVYLAPFEAAVAEGVWLVMSAYSGVAGTSMSQSDLLRDPLKDEWGFDGVVISDWGAVRSTIASASAGMDLVMPGPVSPWTGGLADALAAGEIDPDAVVDKVERILLLADRVGARARGGAVSATGQEVTAFRDPHGPDLLRTAAVEGTVMLRNDGLLPLDPSDRIAVVGQLATHPRILGGGSAAFMPPDWDTPVDALRARFADVSYAVGHRLAMGLEPLARENSRDPHTGTPGMRVRYLASDGTVRHEEVRPYGSLVWMGEELFADVVTVEVHALVTAPPGGIRRLGGRGYGRFDVIVDGCQRACGRPRLPSEGDPVRQFLDPPEVAVDLDAEPGTVVELLVRYQVEAHSWAQVVALSVGMAERFEDADDLRRAVELASAADVVIVLLGAPFEGAEGVDRDTLALAPGDDLLVRSLAAANPRTVVVLDTGAPVLMPWFEDVSAVVVPFLAGQEMAGALADVLSGDAEPGGRLPCTWPRAERDVPVWQVEPVSGVLEHREGVHVGYREWLRRQWMGGPVPLAPFGFGLGYTTWAWEGASLAGRDITVVLRNTGDRAGKTVVQVYLGPRDERTDMPVRWLAGFTVARGEPGEQVEVRVRLDAAALRRWSADAHGWTDFDGQLVIYGGFSAEEVWELGCMDEEAACP